jgi:hypothetical protein
MVQALARKTKRCPLPGGCGRRRRLDKFSRDKAKSDGRCSYCSDCTRKKAEAYRSEVISKRREKDIPFVIPGCAFTETSLEIEPGMGFEEWVQLGNKLRSAEKGVQFWIGDWIRYGEHEYGGKYTQAIKASKRELKTLQNYVYVTGRIDSSRRREVVNFSAHAEVASLPPNEQERILAKAANETFTVRDVRKEVDRTKRTLERDVTKGEVVPSSIVQEYIKRYISALKQLESDVPLSAYFLKNMVHAHIEQAEWQATRTIEDDCAAILRVIEDEYRASDSTIFQSLQTYGYFMSDPELEERLELMVRTNMVGLSGKGKNALYSERPRLEAAP